MLADKPESRLGTGDRIAIIAIVISLAGAIAGGALDHAYPGADVLAWRYVLAGCIAVVVGGIGFLIYDLAVRPRLPGKRLDPLLAITFAALFVAIGALGIYAVRGPESAARQTSTEASSRPDIILVPPDQRHEIVWDPKKQYWILYNPEGQIDVNLWNTPIFYLKNLTSAAAQDATVKWETEISGIEQLVKASPRLQKYTFNFDKGKLTISGGNNQLIPFTYQDMRPSQDIPITFITNAGRGTQAFIPSNVWLNALLYTVALMPDKLGAKLDPFTFSVSVSWNLPTPGIQKFSVKATAVNTKPPNVDEPEVSAFMTFEVEKVR